MWEWSSKPSLNSLNLAGKHYFESLVKLWSYENSLFLICIGCLLSVKYVATLICIWIFAFPLCVLQLSWIIEHVSSLWMEQADFSLEIGWWIEIEEAAHDTFNCNSNRSLFKLCCTRCLNFKHVLTTFVHDAIGLGKLFFRSSSWVQISSLAHSKPRIFYELHQVILQQKDLLREVTRFIAKNFCP